MWYGVAQLRQIRMIRPFERSISEHELYLRLFLTTSGGW
jgi:hypothetical protein